MRLQDKIIAVTGGAGGIGLAASVLFSKEGAIVVILDINAPETEIKNSVFIKTDISDEASVISAFEVIASKFGKLDGLYNNASVFWGKKDNRIDKLDTEVFKKILSINLFGLFYVTKCAIPLIRNAGGGSIINTASSAGVIGIPDCDAYTASKGATVTLTRSMAVEYGPDNIRTNCIAPAAIMTPMVYESNLSNPDFDEQAFLNTKTPLRRWGLPEDIANIALFLMSDEASYLNGAILVADGGITVT